MYECVFITEKNMVNISQTHSFDINILRQIIRLKNLYLVLLHSIRGNLFQKVLTPPAPPPINRYPHGSRK